MVVAWVATNMVKPHPGRFAECGQDRLRNNHCLALKDDARLLFGVATIITKPTCRLV